MWFGASLPGCLNGSGLGFSQVGTSGLLSGTPTTVGTYPCVVTVSYSFGGDPVLNQSYQAEGCAAMHDPGFHERSAASGDGGRPV